MFDDTRRWAQNNNPGPIVLSPPTLATGGQEQQEKVHKGVHTECIGWFQTWVPPNLMVIWKLYVGVFPCLDHTRVAGHIFKNEHMPEIARTFWILLVPNSHGRKTYLFSSILYIWFGQQQLTRKGSWVGNFGDGKPGKLVPFLECPSWKPWGKKMMWPTP